MQNPCAKFRHYANNRFFIKKKIILTGASGNLGQSLVKYTDSNLLKINRSNWSELHNIASEEYDSVIHCAYDLKKDFNEFPDEVLDSNIISTAQLLRISKEKKIKNFYFISSCSIYGESSNSSEEKPCVPITLNGHTKAFNEEIIKNFCLANDINFVIFRAFNSYGNDDHFSVVQKIINCSKENKVFNLKNEGIAERDFIHVDDIAKIVLQLIEKNLHNEIINIGSGNSVKIIDLINAIEQRFGRIQINHQTNGNETVYSRANIKKLKNLIAYECKNIFDFIKELK